MAWCRLSPWFAAWKQKNMAKQRAHGELAPLHAAGISPRALKQRVRPSAKFLRGSGSECLVLRNDKVLPWGFTRTQSERGSVHALVPLSLLFSQRFTRSVREPPTYFLSKLGNQKFRPTDIEKVKSISLYGEAACSGMKGSKATPAAFERKCGSARNMLRKSEDVAAVLQLLVESTYRTY